MELIFIRALIFIAVKTLFLFAPPRATWLLLLLAKINVTLCCERPGCSERDLNIALLRKFLIRQTRACAFLLNSRRRMLPKGARVSSLARTMASKQPGKIEELICKYEDLESCKKKEKKGEYSTMAL